MRAMLGDLLALHRDAVTSKELARWLGTTAATVRKDLSWCRAVAPEATSVGSAYQPAELARRIETYFHPTTRVPFKTAVAGLSEWGVTLTEELLLHPDSPYQLLAGFDSRANRLEQLAVDFPVWPTTDITRVSLRLGLEAAILLVPAAEAQKVAERFVQGGVKRIVNYSSSVLRLNRRQVWLRECGVFAGL
jgi:redox-sensing transcriptional repressor